MTRNDQPDLLKPVEALAKETDVTKKAESLTTRLATHRRMRTERGASLGELELLEECAGLSNERDAALARAEAAEERERGLREAFGLAAPMLQMGIRYSQLMTDATRAQPGSRERQRHKSAAGVALWTLRLASIQGAAQAALAALASAPTPTQGGEVVG